MAGDKIREEHKGSIEYWKDQVRETVGENTISQITNGVLIAYGDTVDLGVGVADTVLDAVLAFSSCTMGASYCDTAMKDLQGANQTVYDAMWALSSGQAWDSIVNTFAKAQQGDQKALEEVAGILSSVLAPSKIVAGNTGKTGSLGNKVENVVSDASNAHKIENAVTDAGQIVNGKPIILENGFYSVDGMKISQSYYDRLWQQGRPAPFIQVKEILNSNPKVIPDPRGAPGYFKYEGGGLEMIYNPTTGQVGHIQPIRTK